MAMLWRILKQLEFRKWRNANIRDHQPPALDVTTKILRYSRRHLDKATLVDWSHIGLCAQIQNCGAGLVSIDEVRNIDPGCDAEEVVTNRLKWKWNEFMDLEDGVLGQEVQLGTIAAGIEWPHYFDQAVKEIKEYGRRHGLRLRIPRGASRKKTSEKVHAKFVELNIRYPGNYQRYHRNLLGQTLQPIDGGPKDRLLPVGKTMVLGVTNDEPANAFDGSDKLTLGTDDASELVRALIDSRSLLISGTVQGKVFCFAYEQTRIPGVMALDNERIKPSPIAVS